MVQATHHYNKASSPRVLLAFKAASPLVANRGQWGDRLGIGDHR